MKKLMIAAAIVCAAMMGQAAAVAWDVEWAYSNDGSSINTFDAPDEMTYWIVNMAGSTDTSGLSVDETGALVNNDSYAVVGTGSFTENGNGVAEGTIANGNYLAMVIYDSANGLYGVSEANLVSGIVAEPPTAGSLAANFSNDGGSNPDGAPYMTANTPVPTTPVPEPTSGLLMLLGVAGLALRRKRA